MPPAEKPPEVTSEFLAETQQPNIYAAIIAPFILSSSAVAARFWCRWKKKAGFELDDGLMLLALCSQAALSAVGLWMLQHGLGRHIELGGPRVIYHFYLGLFIGEVSYTSVIIFVKFSILALYWRIFHPLNIKWEIAVMGTLVFSWGAAVYVCIMQHCYPLRRYWDHDVPGTCELNRFKFFYALAVPNIILDVALLAQPVRYVARLDMKKRQKQAIGALFLLGGFVCMASILRLVNVIRTDYTSPDATWIYVGQTIWALVECNTAIVCGCMPCLGPIFWYIWHAFFADDQQPGEPDPPTGTIKVMNEWTVETDAASSTDYWHREMPWTSK